MKFHCNHPRERMKFHAIQRLLLFFMCMTISYAADIVGNPDFEIPPSNLTGNRSSEMLITKANLIPGWSFNGTVWYITRPDINGHAVQLGHNGKINQTIRITDEDIYDYAISFTLVAQSQDCANGRTSINISVVQSSVDLSSQMNIRSTDVWERHAFLLGQLGGGDSIDFEIKSTIIENSTCWPVLDMFTLNRNVMPRWYNGNMLANGDLEVGPSFLKNNSKGIILTQEPLVYRSPLQQWSILGTIKYIDSKHYKVPQGKAAIELLSGAPSGIRADFMSFSTKLTYTLNFTIGDANDSCIGEFVVYVQQGAQLYNFTMQSSGRGSALKQSLTFKAESPESASISLYSYKEMRRSDGELCGPVLDDIVLLASYGQRMQLYKPFFVFSFFIVLMINSLVM